MAPQDVSGDKKRALAKGAALIHSDEASFRQDSTLHSTWSRRGHQPEIPVTGERKSIKVFGCIEVFSARFLYNRKDVFNGRTYIEFLEHTARAYYPRDVYHIQDNASYHKDADVRSWFRENKSWWRTWYLPPYSPDFNAAEPLWHHTRMEGTHDRYFASQREIMETLTRVFRSMQRRPQQIRGYLAPFS